MKSSELVLNEREVRQRQCSGPFLIKTAKRAGLAIYLIFLENVEQPARGNTHAVVRCFE